MYELYGTQQKNFIETGMLEDTGDLVQPEDYLLADLINEAMK